MNKEKLGIFSNRVVRREIMIKIEDNVYEIEGKDLGEFVQLREKDSHKGMYGKIGIMGGSLEYSGAVKLANMSAVTVKSGCGVVRVIVPQSIAFAISPYLLEETLFPLECDDQGDMVMNSDILENATRDLKALAIGMGWGKGHNHLSILKYLLHHYSGTLVIDADGLNTLSQMDLNDLKLAKAKIVLTPHLKEFQRLTKLDMEIIKKDPISIAKSFAYQYQVILLLKGSTTIVTDGQIVYLSKSGNPGMATAGSGDVLSGLLVGMLGYHPLEALTVAASAYIAGVAGELAALKYTDIAMSASNTIEFISPALKQLRQQSIKD